MDFVIEFWLVWAFVFSTAGMVGLLALLAPLVILGAVIGGALAAIKKVMSRGDPAGS